MSGPVYHCSYWRCPGTKLVRHTQWGCPALPHIRHDARRPTEGGES